MVRAIERVPLADVADFATKKKGEAVDAEVDGDLTLGRKPACGLKALMAALGADKAPIGDKESTGDARTLVIKRDPE